MVFYTDTVPETFIGSKLTYGSAPPSRDLVILVHCGDCMTPLCELLRLLTIVTVLLKAWANKTGQYGLPKCHSS